MSNRFDSTQVFQAFINLELQHSLDRFYDRNATVYIYCHVKSPDDPARRILVIADAHSSNITVSVEAAYQVFEGDIHHIVREIGTVDRTQVDHKLLPLIVEAYEVAVAWRPSFADVEEYIYLPN
jgi:hypothetical protein